MTSNVSSLELRDLGPADEATFFELFAAVRTEELHLQHLPAAARDPLLRVQFDAQRRSYRDEFPSASERLIVRGDEALGWVIVDRSGAAVHGIDIGLVAADRGRGVGTAIIGALQAEAAASGRAFIISVQRLNVRARALYERLGFAPIQETDLHVVMEWRAR
jgi:ribosomal protein S18 acetylase RimI-like enzyme